VRPRIACDHRLSSGELGVQRIGSGEASMSGRSSESFGGPSFRFCGFFLPIPGRRTRLQRMEKPARGFRDLIHGILKRSFVCLRRFVKPADLPHELERSIPNLLFSNWRIEIEKNLNVSAH
jgi:hypothetical protein